MGTRRKRLASFGLAWWIAIGVCGCKSIHLGNDRWTRPGPDTTTEELGGPGRHFTIFRPATLKPSAPRPIVVFAVGTSASPGTYRGLLQHWASHGFVVIAGDAGNQANGDHALQGLAWLIDENTRAGSAYRGALDVARIAAAGHSQGGNTALHLALRDARVVTVIGIEPGEGKLGGAIRADETGLKVPVFYICGEDDHLVPPGWCAERYAATPARAWMAVARDTNHFAPVGRELGRDDVHLRRYTTRWLYARLTGDATAPAAFDGDGYTLASDPDWMGVRRN